MATSGVVIWSRIGIHGWWCTGQWDDLDFQAQEMCCVCGGGAEAGNTASAFAFGPDSLAYADAARPRPPTW